MTNEDKVIASIEELKKSQEAFIAEWRTTRDEAKIRVKELAVESERRRAQYDRDARRAKIISWVLAVFLVIWVIGPAIVSAVLVHFSP